MKDEIRRFFLGIDVSIKDMLEKGKLRERKEGDSDQDDFDFEDQPKQNKKGKQVQAKVKVQSICSVLDEATILALNAEDGEDINRDFDNYLFKDIVL